MVYIYNHQSNNVEPCNIKQLFPYTYIRTQIIMHLQIRVTAKRYSGNSDQKSFPRNSQDLTFNPVLLVKFQFFLSCRIQRRLQTFLFPQFSCQDSAYQVLSHGPTFDNARCIEWCCNGGDSRDNNRDHLCILRIHSLLVSCNLDLAAI